MLQRIINVVLERFGLQKIAPKIDIKKYRCDTCGELIKNGPYDPFHPMIKFRNPNRQNIFFCEGDHFGLELNPDYRASPEMQKIEHAVQKLHEELKQKHNNI